MRERRQLGGGEMHDGYRDLVVNTEGGGGGGGGGECGIREL